MGRSRPMRVLHIISRLGAGGAEQQLRLLLRHMPVRCDVIALSGPGATAHGIRADGIPVTHLPLDGGRERQLTTVPRLVRIIRSGGYDLVHTHLYRACVLGRIAARLAGVRAVIATEHSLGERRIDGRPLNAALRARYLAAERLGSATVAVSAAVADRLRDWGVPNRRIHLVPNGIDARHFRFEPTARAAARARLGIPDRAFVVGGVGRLVADKRFDTAVRAVAEVSDTRLLLVGEGPERPALEDLAARLGVADRVRLLGSGTARWPRPTTGPRGCPRCWPPWTCWSRRPPRRRSASRHWRGSRPGCRCCTPSAPPSRSCRTAPRPAPAVSPPARPPSPPPCARRPPRARCASRSRTPSTATTSPAVPAD
ncbi:hypothetical protein SVIO_030170 [Streptomyces violaceusniger]|uniref:Glycosyltransferase subfamily 4-like N-terminal domain-containing protein n=1 Tax=Streptomyces violaceusniger TaxID=68280 RepID=A0A4D4KW33_STRVO|nr:hypothetical protein SVIO_030170 [Streptomyces violaceusniger]